MYLRDTLVPRYRDPLISDGILRSRKPTRYVNRVVIQGSQPPCGTCDVFHDDVQSLQRLKSQIYQTPRGMYRRARQRGEPSIIPPRGVQGARDACNESFHVTRDGVYVMPEDDARISRCYLTSANRKNGREKLMTARERERERELTRRTGVAPRRCRRISRGPSRLRGPPISIASLPCPSPSPRVPSGHLSAIPHPGISPIAPVGVLWPTCIATPLNIPGKCDRNRCRCSTPRRRQIATPSTFASESTRPNRGGIRDGIAKHLSGISGAREKGREMGGGPFRWSHLSALVLFKYQTRPRGRLVDDRKLFTVYLPSSMLVASKFLRLYSIPSYRLRFVARFIIFSEGIAFRFGIHLKALPEATICDWDHQFHK